MSTRSPYDAPVRNGGQHDNWPPFATDDERRPTNHHERKATPWRRYNDALTLNRRNVRPTTQHVLCSLRSHLRLPSRLSVAHERHVLAAALCGSLTPALLSLRVVPQLFVVPSHAALCARWCAARAMTDEQRKPHVQARPRKKAFSVEPLPAGEKVFSEEHRRLVREGIDPLPEHLLQESPAASTTDDAVSPAPATPNTSQCVAGQSHNNWWTSHAVSTTWPAHQLVNRSPSTTTDRTSRRCCAATDIRCEVCSPRSTGNRQARLPGSECTDRCTPHDRGVRTRPDL